MPTVQEALTQSGFTPEQIAALDPKLITTFSTVLTTAEATSQAAAQERAAAAKEKQDAMTAATQAEKDRIAAKTAQEAAELARRSNQEFYDQTVAPALTGWDAEKLEISNARVKAEAEAAFYRAQAEAAKDAGLIAKDAPKFTPEPPKVEPSRSPTGQYIAGVPGSTPGSPTLVNDVRSALTDGFWATSEFQRLTGQYLPDDIMILGQEAQNQKLPFRDYVERKYDFAGKRTAIAQRQKEEEHNKIKQETAATYEAQLKAKEEEWTKKMQARERELLEKTSNNPDVKTPVQSRMAEVHRGVKEGTRKDPTQMNDNERREATRQSIHNRILDNVQSGAPVN